MSCIITYKGKNYSEEQFKEYFINNKQEFTTSIAKNKDVIDSFKRKMEAIDGVFKDSPELASIGSKIAKEQNNSLFGLNTQNQEQLEFHINTLNVVSKFLENVGVEQRLVSEFLSQDGNVVEGAIAAANFIDGTVDIIDDLEKGRTEAWNKLPEEAAHWWYRLLDTNSPLKKALWESHQTALKNDELYAGQYGKLVKSPSDLTEESIGQLIAEAIKRIETKNGSAADYSFFKKFLEWINSIIDIFKTTTLDPFEVAAMKILSSDMSDLMTWEEYRKINNIVNFADVLTEQSVTPVDYTIISDLGKVVTNYFEPQGLDEKDTFKWVANLKEGVQKNSPEFNTQQELDNWVSANIKEHDIRQRQLAIEVRDNQIFFDRLLNKTFRKKSKFLPKTLRKYFDIIDSQNLNQLREWNISQELQQITKKLSEQEKKQIIETNGYTNIAPTLKVLPDLLQKYKKNPIVLSEPVKIDGAKKQELSILNGIREMIKLENPNLKSITAEEFVNEAHNWLQTNYLLGFANEKSYLSYRTDQTFSYLSDRQSNEDVDITNLTEEEIQRLPFEERQRIANIVGLTKQNPDVYHNKVSLRFNDMYHLKSGHFDKSPSAWGNLTYFYTGKNKWKDAVLLHEIQNDNIEFLREFKAEKVDLETSLGRYLQQLNIDLLDNITQIESGGKSIQRKIDISPKRTHIQLNYQLEQIKDLPLEQGLQQLKQRLNEVIELHKSDTSKDINKAQELVDKAYSQRRKFQDFQRRGGIKSLLTKKELQDLEDILKRLNTEEVEGEAQWMPEENQFEPGFPGIRNLKQKKKAFSNEVIAIQTEINNKLRDTYGDNAPLINLTAPAKPLPKSQRNMRTIGHGENRRRIGGASQELNENVNWLLAYSEKKILDKLSKNIEGSKRNYIQARNATVANNFNVQLSKITLEQWANLVENYKYNEDLLNRLIDEQAQKDVQKESNLQLKKENELKKITQNGLGFWGIYGEYNPNGTVLQFNTKEEAIKYYSDKYDTDVQKSKQQTQFETLKQKALEKKAELEKNYGKIEEEVKQTLEVEMNYFTPLVHHLIQKHISQYGKEVPMYFSGYNITKLTQGNDRTAMIYAGKDEINIVDKSDFFIDGKGYRKFNDGSIIKTDVIVDAKGKILGRQNQEKATQQEYEKAYQQATEQRAKEIKFEAAKQIGLIETKSIVPYRQGEDISLEEGIKRLNEYKRQSKQNMDRVINTIMNISGSTPIETGAIYNAMSQISGIKLIWQDKIDGLKGNTGGYLVDLTNYNYNAPILYGLNTSKVVPINPNMVDNSEIQYSKKQGYNPKTITDEYGNTWNEVEIKEKSKETILLSTNNIRVQLNSLVSTLSLEDVQKELPNLDNINNYIQADKSLSNFLKKAESSNSTLTISFGTELDNEFNSGTNHININLLETKALSELSGYSFKDTLDIMIKHELAHSATYYAVHEDNKIEKSLQELLDVFKQTDKKNPFIDKLRTGSRINEETYQYNLDEFIADIYSNPEFIKYTQSITPEGSKITLLDKVLNWIKANILNKIFGYKSQIKDSLYSEVIKRIETQEVSDLNELASTNRGEDGLSLKANPNTAKSLKEKLHDSLIIQERIYQQSNSKTLKSDIESLQNALKNNTELESFLILIDDASKYLGQIKDRIENITKAVPNYSFKDVSKEKRDDIVHQLNEMMSFMSAYNIIGELQDLSEEEGYEGLNNETLKNALDYRRKILKEYKNLIYPLMADFLYNSDLDETLQKKQGSQFQNTASRESIEEQLRVGITDIGVFERLLGATISSSDPLGGLIASKLKEELERARTKDLEVSNNLLYLYDKLSGPKAIPAELNSKYISKILNYEKTPLIKDGKQVLDENGDPVFEYKAVQRLGIHTPYRTDLLAKSKKELYDRIGQRPPEDSQAFTAWAKEVAKWYSENTIVRNSDKLIQQKKDTLTNFEFLKWFKDNTKELDDYYSELEHEFRYNSMLREYPDRVVTKEDISKHSLPKTYLPSEGNKFYIFTGEFTQPNYIKFEKYRNKEFDKLKEDSYFLALYNTYTDANTKLGTRGLKHGMLPQVYKEGLDKVYDTGLDAKGQFNNFKEYLSNNWGVRGTDAALGIITLDGTETKNIPVYYTQTIPERELSLDLLSSVLRFSQMSNSYEALNKNKAYVETLTDMIKGGKGLSARVVKSEKTNTLKGLINKTIPIATSNTNDQILKFIDQVMYGQSEVQSIATILGEQISLNKVADRMIAYSSVLTLSMNFIGMFNNTIWGNYSTFNEAAVGKYATKIEWLKAQGIYNKELVKGSFIRDVSVITDKSLYTQIAQYFDAFQGEYSSEYGHKISGTKAGRLFSSDILFFTTNAAEHQIQMQGMIMLMLNQKTKLNGKEVNLTEIFEKDNRGILRVKKGAQFSEKDKMAFINKLHAINKSLHGNYNKFDKSLMQRHWWGKLLLQFRKYMYTSYKRRYQKEQIDVELGDTVQGYYNTFFGSLYQAIKQKDYAFLTDFKDKATAEERAAWIKTRADLVFLAGLLIFSSLIGGLGDDDDEYNKTTLNHLSLQSRRLIGDITMLTPIGVLDGDLLRIMRNPVVSTSSTGLLIDAFGQTGKDAFNLVQGKDLEVYKTNTKYHDSGDSKLKYKWQRTIPWFNNYNKLVNPETQLNVFNRPAWQ